MNCPSMMTGTPGWFSRRSDRCAFHPVRTRFALGVEDAGGAGREDLAFGRILAVMPVQLEWWEVFKAASVSRLWSLPGAPPLRD